MRSLAIPFLAVVIAAVTGCDQQKPADAKQNKHRATQPSELSATELSELTDSWFEKAREDASVLESDEFHDIDSAHGPVFKKQLIATIEKSDSITLQEHSDQIDFLTLHWPYSENLPHYVYRSVKLSDAQKAAFLRAAIVMDSSTVTSRPLCFEPHHRLEFVQNNGSRSSMSICFQCKKVVWADAALDPPKGLFGVLEDVVKGAGLESTRDWCALAKQRSEQVDAPDGDKPPN